MVIICEQSLSSRRYAVLTDVEQNG